MCSWQRRTRRTEAIRYGARRHILIWNAIEVEEKAGWREKGTKMAPPLTSTNDWPVHDRSTAPNRALQARRLHCVRIDSRDTLHTPTTLGP